jgi:hypothetical protein
MFLQRGIKTLSQNTKTQNKCDVRPANKKRKVPKHGLWLYDKREARKIKNFLIEVRDQECERRSSGKR